MEIPNKTQVAIIGGGVAGLMLSQLLYIEGIECVILEHQSRSYAEGRISAGVLEFCTVNLLRNVGVSERMDRQGLRHEGFALMDDGETFRIPSHDLVDTDAMVYGQTEITIDLMDACADRGVPLVFEAKDVALHDIDGHRPYVTYLKDGQLRQLECDFIAGCDCVSVTRGGVGSPGDSLSKIYRPSSIVSLRKDATRSAVIAGDAAHIVPPTGAKGLNLTASDVSYLADALVAHYKQASDRQLKNYTECALNRIWKAERSSWSMTQLTNRFP